MSYTYSDAIALLLTDYTEAHDVAMAIVSDLASDRYSVLSAPYRVSSC